MKLKLEDTAIKNCSWIWHPKSEKNEHSIVEFKKKFNLKKNEKVTFQISADQRFKFYVDGVWLCTGPSRGTIDRWFYEKLTLSLEKGEHEIVIISWWLKPEVTPGAQFTESPGFFLSALGKLGPMISTGKSEWKCREVDKITFNKTRYSVFTGYRESYLFNTNKKPWFIAIATNKVVTPFLPENKAGILRGKILSPSMVPNTFLKPIKAGECRFVEYIKRNEDSENRMVLEENNLIKLSASFQNLLQDKKKVIIPSHTSIRVIIDLKHYICGYPFIEISKGKDSVISLKWAESLYTNEKGYSEFSRKNRFHKKNRSEIYNKKLIGDADFFISNGKKQSHTTLWWRSGKYIELIITTEKQSLIISDLWLMQTGYPLKNESHFNASEKRFKEVVSIGYNTLQNCAHETLMDCPYYEQLPYVGDSRLECLVLYSMMRDSQLAKKTISQFDESRMPNGVVRCSFPNNEKQIIPGFAMWWVSMVYDFALYRDDPRFVASMLPGIRAVLEYCHSNSSEGLFIVPISAWGFTDWVSQWASGVPQTGKDRFSCITNLEYLHALKCAVKLENVFGEKEIAKIYSGRIKKLSKNIINKFWNSNRNCLADDSGHNHFSEHSQCIALICDLGTNLQKNNMIKALKTQELYRTTIYYSFYLIEVLLKHNLYDLFAKRMVHWYDLIDLGCHTTTESPEPTRSDCHAWGSHPIFHFFGSILGIRPSEFGFKEVKIQPCMGTLSKINGSMPHPKGFIKVQLEKELLIVKAEITLPKNLFGFCYWKQIKKRIKPGYQVLYFDI